MKSYEEMTSCVLAARDEYRNRRKRRRRAVLRCVPVICCAAVFSGIGRHLSRMPETVPQSTAPEICYQTGTDSRIQNAEKPAATEKKPEQTVPAMTAAPENEPLPQETAEAVQETEQAEPMQTDLDLPQDMQDGSLPEETSAAEPPAQTTVPERGQSDCPDLHQYRPWDELPVYQQYFGADIGTVPAVQPSDTIYYQSAGQELPADAVGAYIGEAFMSGYDFYDPDANRYYHCYAKAYRIKGRAQGDAVAVQFTDGGAYYLYEHEESSDEPELDGLTG